MWLTKQKMNNITFKQYRNIDLVLFGALLALSEAVTTVATNKWFYAQPVAISTTIVFICIVMMRWGGYAVIHACLGGLVFCIASGAEAHQYLIYIVGNCFALVALIWIKLFGKEEIRKSPFKLLLFTSSAYIMMQIGRWLVSLPFGGTFSTLIGYLVSDIISLLFVVVVMLLMRNVDGMIEDQKSYLFRLQREKEEGEQTAAPLGYGDDE